MKNKLKDWFDLSKAEERSLIWGISLFTIAILLSPLFSISKIWRKKDQDLAS
jgi:hypothetical protein